VEGAQLSLRERRCYVFLQAPDGAKAEDSPGIDVVAGLECNGNPELSRRIWKRNPGGRNANDLAINTVDEDFFAEHSGIAAEVLLPVAMA
jgi:hypothetical protein